MKKEWPVLKTDEEAERFVEEADLSEYDFGRMVPMRFEFLPKSAKVNLRVPEPLLAAVKERAKREGMSYQKYIRHVLELSVFSGSKPEMRS